MSRKCTECFSYAINPGSNGRDMTSDLHLCDVCYWRKRADSANELLIKQMGITAAARKTEDQCIEMLSHMHIDERSKIIQIRMDDFMRLKLDHFLSVIGKA